MTILAVFSSVEVDYFFKKEKKTEAGKHTDDQDRWTRSIKSMCNCSEDGWRKEGGGGEEKWEKKFTASESGDFSQFAPLRFVCVSHPPISPLLRQSPYKYQGFTSLFLDSLMTSCLEILEGF